MSFPGVSRHLPHTPTSDFYVEPFTYYHDNCEFLIMLIIFYQSLTCYRINRRSNTCRYTCIIDNKYTYLYTIHQTKEQVIDLFTASSIRKTSRVSGTFHQVPAELERREAVACKKIPQEKVAIYSPSDIDDVSLIFDKPRNFFS